MKMLLPVLILLMLSTVAAGQYTQTIDSLKKVEQACLDQGWRMPACAYQYYFPVDSLMNVVYQRLLLTPQENRKTQLKTEQRLWLKKRDAYFKKLDKQYADSLHRGDWGPEMRVVPLHEKATFVEKRVRELIKQLPAK